MSLKILDKFFDEIKKAVSFLSLILIALSLLLFIYWITAAANLTMPAPINDFVWAVIGFFMPLYNVFNKGKDITAILPVLTIVALGIIIYLLNYLVILLEEINKKCHDTRKLCLKQIEKQINTKLHQSFLDELKTNSLMLVKIKIIIEQNNSYLSKNINNEEIRTIEKEIENDILASVSSPYIKTKGRDNKSVYFLISNIDNTKKLFTELVSNSSKCIGMKMNKNIKIEFCCIVDVFEKISQFEKVNERLNKLLNLKVSNKIAATSAVKVYYENLHPEMYTFRLIGEYNIKTDSNGEKTKPIMLYSLMKK